MDMAIAMSPIFLAFSEGEMNGYEQKDKTMTQIIEEMIDKLKLEKDTRG